MISEITFSASVVKNSITNSDATVTIDNVQPLSFLEYIKNTNVDYSPEEYNNFYIDYLQQWANIVNTKSSVNKVNYIELYVNFLKDIVITYSTQSELKFLSTLNYNDPVDLDIAIPIYVEKIRQIIIFYKEKRDEAKYVIDRSRIKGNSKSIEKAIFEKIYNYIFTSEQQPQYTLLNVSLSSIVLDMKIDIEEFVDVYGNYFDLPRENTSTETLRDELYTSNINSIDINLFFSVVQPGTIFQSSVFLNELPLAINYATTVDLICDPTNPLLLVNTDNNKCGFSSTDKERLKRELISKYIGIDFYYISTLNNILCSGKFITAQNPTSNICNLQTADTATIQSNEIKLLRDLGLFFKPDSNGIFQLNSNNFTYSVDETKLKDDSIYIFPDPNVYGNVSINNQAIYPLVFIHDYTKDVKNISSGFASGDPKVNNYEQTFAPYFAKDQTINISSENNDSYKLNFSDLYNRGYITKVQYDIYGNEYALFKDEFGHTFKGITDQVSSDYILDLLLDGHVFRDIQEGYNFNYSTVGVQDNIIRSGLSTYTVNSFSAPTFTLTGWPLTLYFREFTPYDEFITQRRNIKVNLRDGGEFVISNGQALPDSISADMEDYPGSGVFYYTELADGGVSSLDPLTRATLSLSGDFTYNVASLYYTQYVEEYNCGEFTDDTTTQNSFDYEYNVPYYEDVSEESKTIISTTSGEDILKSQAYKDKLSGNLFVKSQHYSNAYPLSTALNSIFDKYNVNVKSEVYGRIKDFDIIYDTIVCETNSYLVIDKINYNGEFITPFTKNTYFTRNSAQPINKFSNRFFNEVDKTLTFCVTNELTDDIVSNLATQLNEDILTEYPGFENILAFILSMSGSNYKIILPTIYQYDIVQNTTVQVFPRVDDILNFSINIFSLRDYFTPEFNVNIVKVDKPIIAYNSFNRMHKLTYTCTDSNNMFYIFDIDFNIRNNAVTFYNGKFYNQDKVATTSSFYNLSDIRYIESFADINNVTGSLIKDDGTIVL